jgi:hypothetical protein
LVRGVESARGAYGASFRSVAHAAHPSRWRGAAHGAESMTGVAVVVFDTGDTDGLSEALDSMSVGNALALRRMLRSAIDDADQRKVPAVYVCKYQLDARRLGRDASAPTDCALVIVDGELAGAIDATQKKLGAGGALGARAYEMLVDGLTWLATRFKNDEGSCVELELLMLVALAAELDAIGRALSLTEPKTLGYDTIETAYKGAVGRALATATGRAREVQRVRDREARAAHRRTNVARASSAASLEGRIASFENGAKKVYGDTTGTLGPAEWVKLGGWLDMHAHGDAARQAVYDALVEKLAPPAHCLHVCNEEKCKKNGCPVKRRYDDLERGGKSGAARVCMLAAEALHKDETSKKIRVPLWCKDHANEMFVEPGEALYKRYKGDASFLGEVREER